MLGLAIVMPAYRSERTILRSLEGFRAEAPDAQILVVDSGPDGGSAALATTVAGVRAIHSPARLGSHAARNLGARATAAPLLLFADPDVYPRPGSVALLRRVQQAAGGAAAAAIACHGVAPVDRGAHVAKFGPWLPRPGVHPVSMAPTAGLLVPRQDWARLGGIPEASIHGDTLFAWALLRAGVPLLLVGDAVFEHDHGTTLAAFVRERFSRGRDFVPLRRSRRPGTARYVQDVVATATLVRPARVTYRGFAAARRAGGRGEARATFPIAAAGQLAWFAGELAGLLDRRSP